MKDTINSEAAKSILKYAVLPTSVIPDGIYTKPKTWGVYEIEPPTSDRSTRKFRIGNHPIRQRELENEFGTATPLALFPSRSLAEELERLLNGRKGK